MPPVLRFLALLPAAAGAFLFSWSLFVYTHLPPMASARVCGNCFLGTIGLSAELALLGLLLSAKFHLKVRARQLLDWFCAALGVICTPYIIGVPIFVYAFLELAIPVARRLNAVFAAARLKGSAATSHDVT